MPPYIEVLAMENRPKPHPNKACSAIYNHINLLLPDDRKLDGSKPKSGAFEKALELLLFLFTLTLMKGLIFDLLLTFSLDMDFVTGRG